MQGVVCLLPFSWAGTGVGFGLFVSSSIIWEMAPNPTIMASLAIMGKFWGAPCCDGGRHWGPLYLSAPCFYICNVVNLVERFGFLCC